MPRSPWRRIRFASIAAGLMADRSGWINFATGSLAPATGVRTTRFCRTLQRRTSCALSSLTDNRPASNSSRRRCCVHHIPPRVRDDRDTPLLSRRDSAEIATDLGSIRSGKFLQGRLDDPNQIESARQIRFCAQRVFGRSHVRATRNAADLPGGRLITGIKSSWLLGVASRSILS